MEQNEKKQLVIFSLIAFGLPVIMGLFMWYGYHQEINLRIFPSAHMYYPAAAVMIALLLTEKNEPLLPKSFFTLFLVQTVIMIGSSILSLFIANKFFMAFSGFFTTCGSLVFCICLLLSKDEQIAAYGLSFKNRRRSLEFIFLFIFLYVVISVVIYLIDGDISPLLEIFTDEKTWRALFFSLLTFVFSIASNFGEEYGWRYFFQPILQKRFGPLKGVILLGILWGLWHLPLNFFFYTSPEYGMMSVVNQVFGCISLGIFFAYAYMKTDNIWTVVTLHFVNNYLGAILSADTSTVAQNYGISWKFIGLFAIIRLICFGWPAVTKFFRNPKNINPTPKMRVANITDNLKTAKEG